MNRGADVFTALGWGLRKYAWVVVLLTVLVGVLVLFLLSRGTDNYQAQAQVSPLETLKLPNLDPLPRLGDSVFNNGAIADAIRTDQKLPRSASVIPSQVELIAAQDNLIFTVIGHNADPQTAQHLATSRPQRLPQNSTNWTSRWESSSSCDRPISLTYRPRRWPEVASRSRSG